MTALDLIGGLTQATYVVVFLLVLYRTVRQPTPAHVDIAIFFGDTALVILASRLAALLPSPQVWDTVATVVLLMALPYLLLRLVDDFTTVPQVVMRLAELGLAATIVGTLATGGVFAPLGALALVLYFVAVTAYCAVEIARAARRSLGVTRRRFGAAALGTIFLSADLLLAGFAPFVPEAAGAIVSALSQLCGFGSAVAYYLGFAPPGFLRRAWQAPELRRFLARAAALPRLPTTADIVRELELGAAASTGSTARIGLWRDDDAVVRFQQPDGAQVDVAAGQHLAGRAFADQRLLYSGDPIHDDPSAADAYRASRVGAVVCVPITAGERRLGVLALYAERPPIFAVSDMELAQLLADQAAVVLESRALIDDVARMQAREEATRLKEDFLSAAAHDLKTPLTTVVAQAEFLERKAGRDPSAPADVPGLQRIVRESKRLASLVTDLLDAARLEQGRLVTDREPIDLGTVVSEVVARQPAGRHSVEVDVRGAIVGTYDRRRLEQLIDNLIENAKKYSPDATPVRVTVWQQDGEARITVRDDGIGIPTSDLPVIFERFSRASNVDDRKFHGMGLGLYICRGIVEEHGGRIWAESVVGKGSTFHVALPLGNGRRLN